MNAPLPFAVGGGLALAVTVFARLSGFDRERSFYAVVLIVVGSYYELFAVMGGGSESVLGPETLGFAFFAATAVCGFRFGPWIVAAGLVGHGLFDSVHGLLIHNPGVPSWWPAFCGSYDVTAGICLGWMLRSRNSPVAA